jgi:hypothetical protein
MITATNVWVLVKGNALHVISPYTLEITNALTLPARIANMLTPL